MGLPSLEQLLVSVLTITQMSNSNYELFSPQVFSLFYQ